MDLIWRLLIAIVVAVVIVWLLPLGHFLTGLIALVAFLAILFGPYPSRV